MKKSVEKPLLLEVDEVAAIANCSASTVRRLADSGRMPKPVKVGRLIRWQRVAVEEWIANGCPGGFDETVQD